MSKEKNTLNKVERYILLESQNCERWLRELDYESITPEGYALIRGQLEGYKKILTEIEKEKSNKMIKSHILKLRRK